MNKGKERLFKDRSFFVYEVHFFLSLAYFSGLEGIVC